MSLFEIEKILNTPIDSNCYVIYKKNSGSCLIIDPGSEDSGRILDFLLNNKLTPGYIILTHEHFDHIWSLNELRNRYNVKVICSANCAARIVDRKKNMSIFYNQIGFDSYPADILIENDTYCLDFNETQIRFIIAEGHSPGGMFILQASNLFSGDTLIPGLKTVVKFPGGSKEKLENTLRKIKYLYSSQIQWIYPGHGDIVPFNNALLDYAI